MLKFRKGPYIFLYKNLSTFTKCVSPFNQKIMIESFWRVAIIQPVVDIKDREWSLQILYQRIQDVTQEWVNKLLYNMLCFENKLYQRKLVYVPFIILGSYIISQ